MRTSIAALLTYLTVSVAVAQPAAGPLRLHRPTLPSLADSSSAGMYIVQGVLGAGLGAIGALGGGTIGSAVAEARCENSDVFLCGFGTVVLFGAGGYALGVAAGVHAVGRGYPPSGSFGMTLLGSSLGTLAGIGFVGAVADSEHPGLGFAAPLFPIVGAMLAYHASRNGRLRSALVTCEAGRCGLSLPAVLLTWLPALDGSTQAYPLVLARIRL